jgi:hypothetical protein
MRPSGRMHRPDTWTHAVGKRRKPSSVRRVRDGGPFLWDDGRPPPRAAYPGLSLARRRGPRLAPAWPCSGWGLPCRACCQAARWSLTPPFHPCLCPATPARAGCVGHRRSVLCGTFRRVAAPGRYPAPCPVELGLSSTAARAAAVRAHFPICQTTAGRSASAQDGRPTGNAPRRSRTPNLRIRSPTLYPVELWAPETVSPTDPVHFSAAPWGAFQRWKSNRRCGRVSTGREAVDTPLLEFEFEFESWTEGWRRGPGRGVVGHQGPGFASGTR